MMTEEKFAYVQGQKDLIKKIQSDLTKLMDEVDDNKIKNGFDLMFDMINLLKSIKAINPIEETKNV